MVVTPEAIDHPPHYGGGDNLYEAIKVIEAWGLGFCLGNTVKYISRAGKKGDALEDLKKARWYLDREIAGLERLQPTSSAPMAPAPAIAPLPEKSPREKAAEAILMAYPDDLPQSAGDIGEPITLQFSMRTLRAGLELAHKRRKQSRAAAPSAPAAQTERIAARSADSETPGDGAGDQSRDPLALPGFLDRRAPKADAAE